MFLIPLAVTFAFIEHYTPYYIAIFSLSLFILYSTLNIILKIGAEELDDVAAIHKQVKVVLVGYALITFAVFLNSLYDHTWNI